MEVNGDAIAESVLKQFEGLPQKRKPQIRNNTAREWVPLSGIVAQVGDSLECVALGTGMKCLPQNKVGQAKGVVLHDWHAEIVAIRAFNHFLLKECQALAQSREQKSNYLRRRNPSEITSSHFQPLTLNGDVILHMYCSEAPCGDASMEIIMAAQTDATPWAPPSLPPETQTLMGRAHFSLLSTIRRKPSRPDAPPTLSKSCSDKLSLKQCISLLSSPVSLLISPENVYLSNVILSESQISEDGCGRAFSARVGGRMAPLTGRGNGAGEGEWEGGYRFQGFRIRGTGREFEFSRRAQAEGREGTEGLEFVPSNLAAAWTPYGDESLIGGVLQGRKQFDARGASMLCRKRMWELASEVAGLVDVLAVSQVLRLGSYELVKSSGLLEGRRKVKEEVKERALKGWVRNEGDDGFTLDADTASGSRNE